MFTSGKSSPGLRNGSRSALGALALTFALVLASLALAPLASAEGPSSESFSEYAKQVSSKEVSSATVNKFRRTVAATIKGGEEVSVHFPAHQAGKVIAALHAAGAQVKVLSDKEAHAQKAGTKHGTHKKRDAIIAVIVVVVLLAIGGGILAIRRRRED